VTTDNERILQIPLNCIHIDGNQPRKTFNEQSLKELADSIKKIGLIVPITVRKNDDNTYTVLEGERRLKAHQICGIPTIKAIILAEADEKEIADRRLAENVVRENLPVLQLTREFERRTVLGETQEQIAAVVGKTRVYVAQRLALLRLPPEQLKELEEGKITFTAARTLAQHSNAVTLESLKATLPSPACICLTCENYRDCYG
jgi:ParB family chromosome partitioning protein